MKKFLIPFTIGAAVALAVHYFKKEETTTAETKPATTATETTPVATPNQ